MSINTQVITLKTAGLSQNFQIDPNDIESIKFIDHDNSSDRKWLGSHCFWALRNNRMVITCPATCAPVA